MGRFFAEHGYAVVLQDCRGRYASGGVFSFYFRPVEDWDGFDTVEWISDQPWSNGNVGTTGISYGGTLQQALAVRRPPALVTQVILDAGYNYWERMVRYSGAFSVGVHLPYALWMASTGHEAAADPTVRKELRHAVQHVEHWVRAAPLTRGSSPLALAPSYEAWYLDAAERTDYDDVWQNPLSSLEAHVAEYPDIPLCFVTSWYGHHADGNVRKFQELSRRFNSFVMLVIGTWPHSLNYMQATWAGEAEFGLSVAVNADEFRLRWFDRWLMHRATEPNPSQAVEVFVMGGGDGRKSPEGRMRHGGRWRRADAWPWPGTTTRVLFLRPGGLLRAEADPGEEASTSYTFDPGDPVPTIGGNFQEPLGGERAIMHGGGFDQRGRLDLPLCRDERPLAARGDVLVFRSEPLPTELEVVGTVTCELWIASSAPDTDFTAKLIDEYPATADYPDGFALNLTDTIVRLRYRNGAHAALATAPGTVYRLELELPPTGNLFVAGHTIRLDISSSNAPWFDVNPNTGTGAQAQEPITARNTVYHDTRRPSRLVLPVVRPSNSGDWGPTGPR